MNIKDFLIDNYIWILVVILLCIITVIGFLADKKKNKKEKTNENNVDSMPNAAQSPVIFPNQQQMNYQQPQMAPNNMGMVQMPMNNAVPKYEQNLNNNMAVNPNMNMQENTIVNTIPQPIPNQNIILPQTNQIPNVPLQTENMSDMNNSQNTDNFINNPQPVENMNITNNVVQEPMYQPLSEQKPIFAPREINISNEMMSSQELITSNQVAQNFVNPQPVENINVMQVPQMEQTPQMNATIYNQGQQENLWNNPGTVNINQPLSQPQMANLQPMTNMQTNMNISNQQNNVLNPQNNVPNTVTEPQPVNTQASPVGFVFGPQSNNNQNM